MRLALARQVRSKGGAFDDLLATVLADLSADLTVSRLAALARMGERTFARKFTTTMRISPARLVEDLRLHAACEALQRGEALLSELPFLAP
jgi:transcriptional regulator GlxA family with amidase domain